MLWGSGLVRCVADRDSKVIACIVGTSRGGAFGGLDDDRLGVACLI